VLLDEPFSGLDVGSALVIRSLIQELAARGKVVVFSSHELETVERVCSHVVILHRGKIVADDSIRLLVDGRGLVSIPDRMVEHGNLGTGPAAFPARTSAGHAEAHAHSLKTILWFEPERVRARLLAL